MDTEKEKKRLHMMVR